MANKLQIFTSVPAPSTALSAVRPERVVCEPVRFTDLRQVARLQKRAFKPRLAYGFSTLLLLWALPYVRFVVARDRDRIVGCAIGDRNGGQSRVINICVDPAAQNRGLGARILQYLEQLLPIGDIVLMVEADNEPAKALYKKEGYKEVGVSRGYYGRGLDGVWMQKQRAATPSHKIRI
jgi:ribosomal-protein-alanine N-acetyltransferase